MCFLGIIGWLFAQIPGFPFPRVLGTISLMSLSLHAALYLAFPIMMPIWWNIANLVNICILGLALHYTGGILSPFLVILPLIFISGAGYRFNYKLGLLSTLATYLIIIFLECTGKVPPIHVTPRAVYAHWPTTLLVVIVVASLMWIAFTIYDVTVQELRRKLDRENAAKLAMIQKVIELERETEIATLAAGIVHDLRGPLGSIREFVRDLSKKEPALSPEGKNDCALFAGEADRLLGLLEDLRRQTRLQDAPLEEIPVREALQRVLSIVKFYSEAYRVRFELDGGVPPGLRVRANGDRFRQVCFNVLKNGIDALDGRQNPRIDIGVEQDGGTATLSLRDNGGGIPEEILKKLGRTSVSTKKSGTGLGLIIVRDIMSACGGELAIDSREGEGTNVKLTFQRA